MGRRTLLGPELTLYLATDPAYPEREFDPIKIPLDDMYYINEYDMCNLWPVNSGQLKQATAVKKRWGKVAPVNEVYYMRIYDTSGPISGWVPLANRVFAMPGDTIHFNSRALRIRLEWS